MRLRIPLLVFSVLMASSALEAQGGFFTSNPNGGGFRVRREGTDKEVLYGKYPNGPGTAGATQADATGFHGVGYQAFSIAYSAASGGTMTFSWNPLSPASYSLAGTGSLFNAFQFNVRGRNANEFVGLRNVFFNGLAIPELAGVLSEGPDSYFAFQGLDATSDFTVTGELAFGTNTTASAEAHRFGFSYGNCTNTSGTACVALPTNSVPEPSSYALLVAGLAGILVASRRRREME